MLHLIGETIGAPVFWLRDNLPYEELLSWGAYFTLKRKMEEKAHADAKRKTKSRPERRPPKKHKAN